MASVQEKTYCVLWLAEKEYVTGDTHVEVVH
jgi:hypothetical protein